MPIAPNAATDRKKELRATLLAQRRALPKETRRCAAGEAAAIFLDAIPRSAVDAVSGYWPIRGELDPRPLMASLTDHGHPLFLPVVLGDGQPLQFRGWRDGEALQTSSFGTKEPMADAPEGAPDIVIVPLLAFDEGGYRLGYGKGFFDMTLAELRRRGPNVLSVGFAYEAQRSDDLPRDDWDEPLDWIVTERKVRRIQ